MQTFLPYPNFKKSASILDFRRLGKQRQEALDIYRIITKNPVGASEKQMAHLLKRYPNHTAVNMWRGYEKALLVYGITMCIEWKRRGYKDTTYAKFVSELNKLYKVKFTLPTWLGDEAFHTSHKSSLMRKKEEFYKTHFSGIPNNIPYVWPSKIAKYCVKTM